MSESVSLPTTREEFEARRFVTVTLDDGTRIRCRRTTMRDLFLRMAVSFEFVAAVQGLMANKNPTEDDAAQKLQTVRDNLVKVAIFVAIDPPISETAEPAPSKALWADLLTVDELGLIYRSVTETPTDAAPMGAAATETFRGDVAADAGTPPSSGEDVRPETEQLDPGGSVDLQHA